MDDLITGSDSIQKLKQLQQDVTQILANAGMELRKWNSNILNLFADSEIEASLTSKEEIKTLGIRWNSSENSFKFKMKIQL